MQSKYIYIYIYTYITHIIKVKDFEKDLMYLNMRCSSLAMKLVHWTVMVQYSVVCFAYNEFKE